MLLLFEQQYLKNVCTVYWKQEHCHALDLLEPKVLLSSLLPGVLLSLFSAMSMGVRWEMETGVASPWALLDVTVNRYSLPGRRPVTVNLGDRWLRREATLSPLSVSYTFNNGKGGKICYYSYQNTGILTRCIWRKYRFTEFTIE